MTDEGADERLRAIQMVVVIRSSSPAADLPKSQGPHPNDITQPVDLRGLARVVHKIDNFWLSVARPRSKGGPTPD